jgi:peptide/nickel transport system substrate-binding protein
MKSRFLLCGAALAAAAVLAAPAAAKTFKYANQGDALSMDPHSLNESLQLNFTFNVYEPLVGRGRKLELVPALATDWKQTAPTVWRFSLRKGVQFHDGTPFTADDVVFSYNRAKADGSDVKTYVGAIKEIRKIDEHAVDIVTNEPFPILPDVITNWAMMSRKWCEENRATVPVDKRKGVENTASFKANGTGPFRVRSREPGVRTTLVRNLNYWDKSISTNIDEAIFTPIGNASTRVAALLSGEIDMMEPVPVQDVARLAANAGLKVMQAPELRTIFLGMDQSRNELLFSNVKGKNPFKDRRVRQAFYQAIDINAIQKAVMRGASAPTGLMIAPGIKGFPVELNKRLPYDPAAAQKLLADAGYAQGFEVGMNCPNDRYVNDEEICKAVSAMLAKIGVKVNLMAQPKGPHFTLIQKNPPETEFFLLGWGVPPYDSHYIFSFLYHTRSGSEGTWNATRYSNAEIDGAIRSLTSEVDTAKRDATIAKIWKVLADETNYIALHHQMLAYAMKRDLDIPVSPENTVHIKFVAAK